MAGSTLYSDHISVSVPESPTCPGSLIRSTIFLPPKWPGLKDKLYSCPTIVAYLGNKKKPRVSGPQGEEGPRLERLAGTGPCGP